MWWWEVRYRDPASGRDIVLAPTRSAFPVGRVVYLGLTSADVIHSFWVPPLAGKMDMVPGRVNRPDVQRRQTRRGRGQCAEFCGEQHARMALHVVAMAPADFDAWLARRRSRPSRRRTPCRRAAARLSRAALQRLPYGPRRGGSARLGRT
jgi:cytochrome c oxidase subunit 2